MMSQTIMIFLGFIGARSSQLFAKISLRVGNEVDRTSATIDSLWKNLPKSSKPSRFRHAAESELCFFRRAGWTPLDPRGKVAELLCDQEIVICMLNSDEQILFDSVRPLPDWRTIPFVSFPSLWNGETMLHSAGEVLALLESHCGPGSSATIRGVQEEDSSQSQSISDHVSPQMCMRLYLTNYRLLFVQEPAGERSRIEVSIPILSILKQDVISNKKKKYFLVSVHSRDCKSIQFTCGKDATVVTKLISKHLRGEGLFRPIFTTCKESGQKRISPFQPEQEFMRLGLVAGENPFYELESVNMEFKLCQSYPETLLLPRSILKHQTSIAEFASSFEGGRFPMIVWGRRDVNADGGLNQGAAVLCRCHRYVSWSRDSIGSGFLEALSLGGQPLRIVYTGEVDPSITSFYGHLYEIVFAQLPELRDLQSRFDLLSMSSGGFIHTLNSSNGKSKLMESENVSNWLDIAARAVNAAGQIADWLRNGQSVLVQCSEDCDYGNILTSLTQILLDPYYRTFHGLCVLMDKEFCKGGYEFDSRSGRNAKPMGSLSSLHSSASSRPSLDAAPGFMLWLWCLWSLLIQSPSCFDYDERLLIFLADSVYSTRFVEFCTNSQDERATVDSDETPSVWSFLLKNSALFRKPNFDLESGIPLSTAATGASIWVRFLLRSNTFFAYEQQSKLPDIRRVGKSLRLASSSVDDTFSNFCQHPVVQDVKEIFLVKGLLTSVPPQLGRLRCVKRLILDENLICCIPEEIFGKSSLLRLKFLSLRDNLISLLPGGIATMTHLMSLDLSSNLLETLPRAIGNLISLRHLVLSRNKLNRLPPSFRNLTKLETLDLSFNMFSSLPGVAIAGLVNLELLNISNNKIVLLPTALSKLTSIRTLNINSNLLEQLPNDLDGLTRLEFLKLSRNRFRSLPEVVCRCISLTKLEAAENNISDLPLSIGNLCNLRFLELGWNCIAQLPHSVGLLRNLHSLGLKNNRLKEVSHILCLLGELETLEVDGNPTLARPPAHILCGGTANILNYLRQELETSTEIHSIRMLVLGKENVGKTSFVRALAGNAPFKNKGRVWAPQNEPPIRKSQTQLSTDGIDQSKLVFQSGESISKSTGALLLGRRSSTSSDSLRKRYSWHRSNSKLKKLTESQDIEVNVLDFAGQNCYYSTHQLFLTSDRSLHIVVFDMSDQSCDHHIEFWLQSIYCAQPRAHIICVGTHLDRLDQPRDEVGRWLEEKRLFFRRTFPTFSTFRFAAVSLSSGENFEMLRKDIEHVIASRTPVHATVPFKYIIFQESLSSLASKIEPPIVTRFELEKYARSCGLADKKDFSEAANFLHSLGSIIFYESDRLLGHMAILNPDWLMKLVNGLFSTSHNFARDGVLKHSDLAFVWRQLPQSLYGHFLALLERFEIVYQLPPSKILPDRFTADFASPKTRSRKLNSQKALDIISGRSAISDILLKYDTDSVMSTDESFERRPSTSTTDSSGHVGTSFDTPLLAPENGPARPSKRLSTMLLESTSQGDIRSVFSEWALNGPEFDHSAISLIPALLPTQEPRSKLRETWFSASQTSVEQLNRIFEFRFLPPSFMSRLLTRLLHHTRPISYWRDGILCKRTIDDHILVMARSSDHPTQLEVAVRASAINSARNLLELVVGMVDSLISEWPSLELKRYCTCPVCLGSESSGCGTVPLDDLDRLVPKGASTIICSNGHKVAIDAVAPEISLAAFDGPLVKWNDIKINEIIGAYAVVRRGKWKGQVVAVKTLRKMTKDSDSVSASQFREFRAEANALNGVPRHKNVMAPVALVLNPPSLLFEFVKGMNLFEFIHQLGDRISWSVVFSIARQVASGLRHLHSQEPEPLAHLDLKSPNIILQMDENDDVKVAPNVKIIDFGLSSRVGPRKLRGRRVENPTWLAPEILRNEPYDEKVDIYAFGVILFELGAKKHFFGDFDFMSDVEDAVCSGKRPHLPSSFPPLYSQLVQRCWDDNSRKRPTVTWILNTLDRIEASLLHRKPLSMSSSPHMLGSQKARATAKTTDLRRHSLTLVTRNAPMSNKQQLGPENSAIPEPPPFPSWFYTKSELSLRLTAFGVDPSLDIMEDSNISLNLESPSLGSSSKRGSRLIRKIVTFFAKPGRQDSSSEEKSAQIPNMRSQETLSTLPSSEVSRLTEQPATIVKDTRKLGLISKSSSDSLISVGSDAGSETDPSAVGLMETIHEEDE